MMNAHNHLTKGPAAETPEATLRRFISDLKTESVAAAQVGVESQTSKRLAESRITAGEILRLKAAAEMFNTWQGSLGSPDPAEVKTALSVKYGELDRALDLTPPPPGDLEATIRTAARLDGIKIYTFSDEAVAEDVPARTWFVDGLLTPGLNVVTAKKGIGKSFFVIQLANAIASGLPFLGRATKQGRVLYVPTELDRIALHERAPKFAPCSPDVLVVYEWPSGQAALDQAEAFISAYNVKVLIFDMFLQILPEDLQDRTNDYGTSRFYRAWRRLGQRYGAAIVAVWHSGKTERDDFMASALGSTGLTAQGDCVLSLDRKRGESGGKLFVGGNHGKEEALSLTFEDGRWTLDNSAVSVGLSRSDEELLAYVAEHPEGVGPTETSAGLSRPYDAVRMALSRLAARGFLRREGKGRYFASDRTTEQDRTG